jgi:hypothetical protein
MGVEVHEIDGVTVYLHGGAWGTLAAYVPSLGVALGATVTQHQAWPGLREMFGRALMLVRDAVEARQAQS